MEPPDGLRQPDDALVELSGCVVDAAREVYQTLGAGFVKSVYRDALALELGWRGHSFAQQVAIGLHYREAPVGMATVDFLVGGRLVVALEAADTWRPLHTAQMLTFLCAMNEQLGLVINFNASRFAESIRHIIVDEP